MIDSCVFCRVVVGTIEASIVHDDDHVLARYHDDGLLRVYPRRPDSPTRDQLDAWAAVVRASSPDLDHGRGSIAPP